MRELFPGWVPPDAQTLDRYWNEATFAVDASVLLDLYRFSEQARGDLLKALRSLERLWIPHQVGLEFHRNRLGVLLDQREAEGNLLRELDQIRGNLDEQLSQLLRKAGRRDLAPLKKAIDDSLEVLREKVKEAEKEHTKGLGESIRDDPIYEEVVGLCADRVGGCFDEERHREVLEEADARTRRKVPPGYLDDGKDGEAKYGDVVLWYQLCDQARETGRPVVLITDDRKADWFWEERGKSIGPRPELVAEMNEKAAVGFHLYTPTRFLEVWEKREEGRAVEPEVLAEIEGSSKSPPSPSIGTFAKVLLEALLQSGRPAKVFHQVEDDKVKLMLYFQPPAAYVAPPAAVVTVRGPAGSKGKVIMHPLNAHHYEAGGQLYMYSVNYPQQFSEGQLGPGSYEVIWEVMASPDGSIGPTQEVARDIFVVKG